MFEGSSTGMQRCIPRGLSSGHLQAPSAELEDLPECAGYCVQLEKCAGPPRFVPLLTGHLLLLASRCDDRMFIPLACLPNRMISRQRFVEQSRELKIAAALRVSASTRASVWRLSPSSLATAKHTMLQPRELRRSSKSCRWLHERVLFATSCVPAPFSQKHSFS